MKYKIPKLADSYSSVLSLYGISKIIQSIQENPQEHISIENKGMCYEIEPKSPIKPRKSLELIDPMFFVTFSKTIKYNEFPYHDDDLVIDLEDQKEKYKQKKDGNQEIAVMNNYQFLWNVKIAKGTGNTDEKIYIGIKNHQPEVLDVIYQYLEIFSKGNLDAIYATINESVLEKEFGNINHLKATDPFSSKGVYKKYASDNNIKVTNGFYEWAKWIGLSQYTFSSATKNEIYFSVPVAQKIYLDSMEIVLNAVRSDEVLRHSYGKKHNVVLFNTILSSLVNHQVELEEDEIANIISSLITVTFMDFGQAYGPIHSNELIVPHFIRAQSDDEIEDWISVFKNFNEVFSWSDEKKHSELYLNYKDFISSSQLEDFAEFCSYHAILRNHDNGIRSIKRSTLKKIMISMEEKIMKEIFENEGFQAIATAIKNSTVRGQYMKSKKGEEWEWSIKYDLPMTLKQNSRKKESFMIAISDFIQEYNRENARMTEKQKVKHRRKSISQQNVVQFSDLIDNYDASLLCNVLLAYGSASSRNSNDLVDKTMDLVSEDNDEDSYDDGNLE